jgi:CheY-like chemotaxis protein
MAMMSPEALDDLHGRAVHRFERAASARLRADGLLAAGRTRVSTARTLLGYRPAPSVPPRVAAPRAEPLRGLTVLLVESNASRRDAMQWAVSSVGASVLPVSGAGAALAMLDDEPSFDVILSALDLPEMSGFTFIELVTEHYRGFGRSPPPSCAVGAYARELDRQRALAAGFDMCLFEPVPGDELLEAVVVMRNILRCEN